MKKILVELDLSQASCLAACARFPIKEGTVETQDLAAVAATVATAHEGAEIIEAALNYVPHEIRSFVVDSVRAETTRPSLSVDSGWNAQGTHIALATSRGRSVYLNIEEWRVLVNKMEEIFRWCEYKRTGASYTEPESRAWRYGGEKSTA